MTAAPEPIPRWSRRRWWLTVAALALGQTALVLALSQRAPARPRPPAPEPALRVLAPARPRAADPLPGTDPTLFALINPRGFSGPGWLRFDYAAHELRDWQDDPSWLTIDDGRFGADFRRLAANSGADRLSFADKPPPRHTAPALAPLPVRERTGWRVTGDLGARPLLSEIELPAWPHTDVLGRTVLQLVVTAGGDVLAARVLKSSGLAAADAFAAQTFEHARFQPASRAASSPPPAAAATALGTVTIEWQTRLPATNSTVTVRAR